MVKGAKVKELGNGLYEVYVECIKCHKEHKVSDVWTEEQINGLKEYFAGYKVVQKCLPFLSADERDIFVTGFCPTCWDILFGDNEDD